MKTPNTKPILNTAFIIGIILIGKKLGEKLGIFDTKEDVQAEELESGSTGNVNVINIQNPSLALNPNYFKTIATEENKKRKLKGLPSLTANNYVKLLSIVPSIYPNLWNSQINRIVFDIKNSKGFFNDNEDALYNQFQKMKSLFMISYVSNEFQKKYNLDMWNYIKDFTNTDEQAKIYTIIKNKPLLKF